MTSNIPEDQNPQEQAETLVQVRAPYFCAGLIFVDGVCTEAAPILKRFCLGKRLDWLRGLFPSMHWTICRPHRAGLAGQDFPERDPSDRSVPEGMMRVSGRSGPSPRASE